LAKATTEGVVRLPSEFSSTNGSPPSMTAMQELVVPRSIPRTFAIVGFRLTASVVPQCLQGGCRFQRDDENLGISIKTDGNHRFLVTFEVRVTNKAGR
jgi:hypothetical protein